MSMSKSRSMISGRRRPIGFTLLVIFFWFGTTMCALTILLLVFAGTPADILWRINPTAHQQFAAAPGAALLIMLLAGAACGCAAIGLAREKRWGRRLAIGVLAVNIIGEIANTILRSDWRTLLGLPIGGALIWYLARLKLRGQN
jgi:Predicted membrane protein (DUF2127)